MILFTMRNFFAGVFRNSIYPIVSFPLTYYLGMILVRLSRMARKYYYHPASKEEYTTVQVSGNLKMTVDINSYMGGSIYWTGFHHLNEILFLDHTLKDGMTFIDVGANQGEFSVFAASNLPNGRVLAFEPVSKTRNLLLQNKRVNNLQHLEVYDFGLSDHVGSFPVYTSADTTLHHGYHEGLSTLFKTEARAVFEEKVSLRVFDDVFYSDLKRLDFVKIDVEGAELFVLKGMLKSLKKFKPALLIEINEETFHAGGYGTADIVNLLMALGYKPQKIRRGKSISIDYSALDQWGNYLFQIES